MAKPSAKDIADAVGLAINTITYKAPKGRFAEYQLSIQVLEKIKSDPKVMTAMLRAFS